MKDRLLKLPYQLFIYLLATGIIANVSVLILSYFNENKILSFYTLIILGFSILALIFYKLRQLHTAIHIMLISYLVVFLHASFSSIGYLPLVLVFPIIIGLNFVFFQNFFIKLVYSIVCTVAAIISSSLQLRFIENVDHKVILSSAIICLFMMIAFSVLNLIQSKFFLEYRLALESKEKKLEHQKNQLEKYISSNIKLEQFAHIAAHDLKSPLRNIASFTGLLKRRTSDKLTNNELEYINIIENSSFKMNELVEDLLVYSKANSQELKRSKFSLDILIEEVMDNHKMFIKTYEIDFKVKACEVIIYADKIKFRQVLQNIINNAIKFRNPERSLMLEINYMSSDSNHIILISDNGIGIEDNYKFNVFKEFAQLNPNKYEGTGMGLSIVRNIVERHNGSVNLKNNIPFGLTVEIIFPIEII